MADSPPAAIAALTISSTSARLLHESAKSPSVRFAHIRLMLTLELAVMLPAAALIYVNFDQLKSIERDKVLEAAIHRDFHQMLAISEKKINQKAYAMTEEVRNRFPSPDTDKELEKVRKLDRLLSERPWLAHVFIFDAERGLSFRSQPRQLGDPYVLEEHEDLSRSLGVWFGVEAKMMLEGMHRKSRPFTWYGGPAKRPDGYAYMTSAFFPLLQLSKDRVVLGGVCFEPNYLKHTFFPEMLEELIAHKLVEEGGNRLAMIVYPAESEPHAGWSPSSSGPELLAASDGWTHGKLVNNALTPPRQGRASRPHE